MNNSPVLVYCYVLLPLMVENQKTKNKPMKHDAHHN